MKMTLTTYENQAIVKKDAYFLSAFFMPCEGVRALVLTEDNQVHEVNPYDLTLSNADYNKIFTK